MKFTSFLLLLLFSAFLAKAQTLISGTVVNENKNGIVGAAVYVDGTSFGTTTDANGRFELHIGKTINAQLVVNAIGFKTKTTAIDADNKEIVLEKNIFQLEEVLVNSIFSREEMLKAFKEQLLGLTPAGKACNIKNEEDLQLRYANKTLHVTAQRPLIIINPVLGYEILFSLEDFHTKFRKVSLADSNVNSNYFEGTMLFKETTNDPIVIQNRKAAYEGSTMAFFRDMIAENWSKKTFSLYYESWPTKASKHFVITDSLGLKFINVLQASKEVNITLKNGDSITAVNYPAVSKKLDILYKNRIQSAIYIKTKNFFVDRYGNFSHRDKIFFSGDMSKRRLGDMLPSNYGMD